MAKDNVTLMEEEGTFFFQDQTLPHTTNPQHRYFIYDPNGEGWDYWTIQRDYAPNYRNTKLYLNGMDIRTQFHFLDTTNQMICQLVDIANRLDFAIQDQHHQIIRELPYEQD